MLIGILPLLIALISTMIGVFGNSWNEEKTGWQRLTVKGWLVIALAVGSFGVATFQVRDAYQAKQEKDKKEQLLRTLASQDVDEALNELLRPFKLILDERGGSEFNDPINQHLYRATDRLKDIGSESFLSILDQVKAMDCPRGLDPTGCSWARGFDMAMSRGSEGLRDAAIRYADVLSPATLTLIQSVRDHKMLGIMRSMPGNIEINQQMGNTDIAKVSIGWLIRGLYEPSDYYVPFFVLLQKIEDELWSKRGEPDKWWVRKPPS